MTPDTQRSDNASPAFPLAQPAIRIAPSLLAADFAKLRDDVAKIEDANIEGGPADLLHLDVMDGHFVPNISFGPALIEHLRPHSKLFFDAHLMISDPLKYAESFAKAGCDHITFHIETAPDPRPVIDKIRDLNLSVGICLNPTTEIDAIESILPDIDMVLIMSVWPGFGGQSFIPDVLPKVRQLRRLLKPYQRLEIDGGIDPVTIQRAADAGADTFVAGSAIFKQPDPVSAMSELRQAAYEHRYDRQET
jgi:ribulose-phosphate 3-epimerase